MEFFPKERFKVRVIFADGHCRAQQQRLQALLDAMEEWGSLPPAAGGGEAVPVGDLISALLDVSCDLDTASAAIAAAIQLPLRGTRPAPLPSLAQLHRDDLPYRDAAMKLHAALRYAQFAQSFLDSCIAILCALRHMLATPALPDMPALATADLLSARSRLKAALQAVGELVLRTNSALNDIGLGGGRWN